MSTSHAESRTWRPKDTLAHRVMLMRTELGLSQREAAMQSGVSFGTIQGVESGRTPRNEVATLAKLAKAFHVDRDWLIWGGPLDTEDVVDPGPGVSGEAADTARYTPHLGSRRTSFDSPETAGTAPKLATVTGITKRARSLHTPNHTTNTQRSLMAMAG